MISRTSLRSSFARPLSGPALVAAASVGFLLAGPPSAIAQSSTAFAADLSGSDVGSSLLRDGPDDPKQTALSEVEAIEQEIRRLSLTLWDYAETGLREDRSAKLLADVLEREGFRVERGVAGMPTAFVATYGSGKPVVGILAEYDALPGAGNAPVPRRAARDDGVRSGHGCGHNLFGAGSVTAGIALKRTMEKEGLEGTVRVYGTPAEETLIGKVYMAREGLYDDLDAALSWHPGTETDVSNSTSLAMNNYTVSFSGQAAHGAADPWNGRSALDAVELLTHGINLMREHVRPTARIHYVVTDGGQAPNVVPEEASLWGYVRDTARSSVESHFEWIRNIAHGAARATKTEAEVELITGVHSTLLNRPLQEAVQANLETVAPADYPDQFHQFARELQESLDIEQKGLDTEVKPLEGEPGAGGGGSTDVAEVSRITPTVNFNVTSAPADIPWHSWATTASHGQEGSVRSAVVAAKVLAATGVDLLTRPELVERAREEFERKMGGEEYESPLPPGAEPPLPEEGGG